MNPGPRTPDERLVDLETRYAFLEDLVEKLDRVIVEQADRIEGLRREVAALRERVRAASSEGAPGDGDG